MRKMIHVSMSSNEALQALAAETWQSFQDLMRQGPDGGPIGHRADHATTIDKDAVGFIQEPVRMKHRFDFDTKY